MTPFSLFREVPARLGSRPTLWKVLLASALSMTLAVVLMAWQASRFCQLAHHHPRPAAASASWHVGFSTATYRRNMESGCAAMDHMRATRTGLYAPEPSP